MESHYNFRVVLKLFILLCIHLCVAAALLHLLGWTQLPFALFLMMSIDELVLLGQPGKMIAKWIFHTEDVPVLARVTLFVIYLIVFFFILIQ